MSVQTESTGSTRRCAAASRAGIFPITVELRIDEEPVGSVTTFVDRVGTESPDGPGADDLAVGLVLGTTRPPTIAAGRVRRTVASRSSTSSARLARRTRRDGRHGGRARRRIHCLAPSTVEPATIAVLPDVDPDLSDQLVPLLANGDVIALPARAVRPLLSDRRGTDRSLHPPAPRGRGRARAIAAEHSRGPLDHDRHRPDQPATPCRCVAISARR